MRVVSEDVDDNYDIVQESADVFHCALCGTGKRISAKVCQLICASRRHLKGFEKLKRQRTTWLVDEAVRQRAEEIQDWFQKNNDRPSKNKNEPCSGF